MLMRMRMRILPLIAKPPKLIAAILKILASTIVARSPARRMARTVANSLRCHRLPIRFAVQGLFKRLTFRQGRQTRIQVLDACGDPWGIECRSDYDAFLERRSTLPPDLQ